jgi:predicted amidohydrolase YtcJ
VNQATLDALGLEAGDPGVVLDPDGQPTGLLTAPATGQANQAILDHLGGFTMEERADCLADFMRTSNRLGLTAWKDAGGNQAPWGPLGEIGSREVLGKTRGPTAPTGWSTTTSCRWQARHTRPAYGCAC